MRPTFSLLVSALLLLAAPAASKVYPFKLVVISPTTAKPLNGSYVTLNKSGQFGFNNSAPIPDLYLWPPDGEEPVYTPPHTLFDLAKSQDAGSAYLPPISSTKDELLPFSYGPIPKVKGIRYDDWAAGKRLEYAGPVSKFRACAAPVGYLLYWDDSIGTPSTGLPSKCPVVELGVEWWF